MDPNVLPLPSNLPSTESWRADLDTWEDKYVLVDSSGLVFFENQKREYVASPISWVKRSARCSLTSEHTANSGRPSEYARRKSIAVLNNNPTISFEHVQEDVPKEVPSISKIPEKRRRVQDSSTTDSISGPQLKSTIATSNLTSLKKPSRPKYDWRRLKKSSCAASSNALPTYSRKIDTGNSLAEAVETPQLERLRTKFNIPPNEPLVCSVCCSPSLIKDNWKGYTFGKLACQPCGRFLQNNFIYTISKSISTCISDTKECSVLYTAGQSCRFCRLKKCLNVWPPEKLALQKITNDGARKIWLAQRKQIFNAIFSKKTSPAKSVRPFQRNSISSETKSPVKPADAIQGRRSRLSRSPVKTEPKVTDHKPIVKADESSQSSSEKDFGDGPTIPVADLEIGDFVIDNSVNSKQDMVEKETVPKTKTSVDIAKPGSSTKAHSAKELSTFDNTALKPRAAALAANTAIHRSQQVERRPRLSNSPSKQQENVHTTGGRESPNRKKRRANLVVPRFAVSKLKSVKPGLSKRKRRCFMDKASSPRTAENPNKKAVLDSPEIIPRSSTDDKAKDSQSGESKVPVNRKPRIKHVFRHGSSTFLSRNSTTSPSSVLPVKSAPAQAPIVPPQTHAASSKKHHVRSTTPPPPLRAPFRVSVEKSKPFNPLIKSIENGAKKSKKSMTITSPTKPDANRCNRCMGCRAADCGKCKFCRDMPKFGGPGRQQKACEKRVCESQQLKLEDFTYRRIKLPTIQLPPDIPLPMVATKEAAPLSKNESANVIGSPLKTDEVQKEVTSSPKVASLSESPADSTEQPRRSSICSTGLNCGSPVSNSILQSPVQEVVVETQEDRTGNYEKAVDVSRLKPVLSEFEHLNVSAYSKEFRKRRVCAAMLADVGIERALAEGIAVITTASLVPATRALCLLCGSAGREQMIFCQLCAHPFHSFCLVLLDEDHKEKMDLNELDLSSWLCPSCQYCELCYLPATSNNKIAKCSRCHHRFHPSCLAPNYKPATKSNRSVWACSRCVKCELCGATHPGKGGQWSPDFKYCQSCYEVRCNNYCPECNETYSPDDYTLKMLQCYKCNFWVHANPCANMTDDLYDLFEFLPDSVRFVCMSCARKSSLTRPMIWEVRVQRLLADRLGDALSLFLQHVQTVCSTSSSFSGEAVQENEDTVQCLLASAAIDSEEQKDMLKEICELFVKGSYRDVSVFLIDFWHVLKINSVKLEWLVEFFLNALPDLSDEFKQRVRTVTKAKAEAGKGIETRNKNSMPKPESAKKKKGEKSEDSGAEKKTFTKSNKPFLEAARRVNDITADARMCRLCCRFGDDDAQEAGRLLYVGQDDWVHVNCALWSAEVFERGSMLCNVTSAISRSRHLKCSYCGRTGATLQCNEPGCRIDFHFMCARDNEHEFTRDHRCYCSKHLPEESDSDDEDWLISDFSVDRRLICDQDSIRWRRNWLDGFSPKDLTVVIGSISVLQLGQIHDLSDLRNFLIPINYAIERVHWSLENPTQLGVYRCAIEAVQSPNVSDLNLEATTIAFKTPVKIEEVAVGESPEKMEQPPLPEPEPSPTVTELDSVRKNIQFQEEVLPTTEKKPNEPSGPVKPIVTWSGCDAMRVEEATPAPQAKSPLAAEPVQPSKSPPRIPAKDSRVVLNKLKKLIDSSPERIHSREELMKTVQRSVSPTKRMITPSSGVEDSPLSRQIPFAHLKSQQSPKLTKLPPPVRVVKPKVPNFEFPPVEATKSVEVTNTKPELEKEGCAVFFPRPDNDVVSVLDHVVSRIAYEHDDFSRHGLSLRPEYSSMKETTLNILKTAAGIAGRGVLAKTVDDNLVSTMWNKYKFRIRSSYPSVGPKPVIANPMPHTGSVPIILNHNRMNSIKPPELELFPVSLFSIPAYGERRRRHLKAIHEAEMKIQQDNAALMQKGSPSKTTPMVRMVSRPPGDPVGQRSQPIPVAKLSFVTHSVVQNGVPATRIVSVRSSVRPVIQPVKPIIVPAQTPPAQQVVNPVGSPPTTKVNVSALTASRLSLGGQPVRIVGRLDSINGQLRLSPSKTGNIFTVPLQSVSPTKQQQQQQSYVRLCSFPPPKTMVSSPPTVRFQDVQLQQSIISPLKILSSPPKQAEVPQTALSMEEFNRQSLDSSQPTQLESVINEGVIKTKKPHKRKEPIQKRDISLDHIMMKKSKSKVQSKESNNSNSKRQLVVKTPPRPKTPLSLTSLLPKSPLKSCLPASELALAEIINRVVNDPSNEKSNSKFSRKQQRFLVFDIAPVSQAAESQKTWNIRGFTWQDSWRVFFSRLSLSRQSRGLPSLSYDTLSGLSLFGLSHNCVIALLEQLPGVEEETNAYNFRFACYERVAPNPAGCARAIPYTKNWCPGKRRHRDVFSFLLSKLRKPRIRKTPQNEQEHTTASSNNGFVTWEVSRPHKAVRRPTTMTDLPLPTRLRYLKETARFDVGVFHSSIHARGLYALRDFEAQEMIIEYAGELIRATLTDQRERMYERQGIGCYMFRLDDTSVIDATRCGNAGRFINHCCEPNCYSRVIVGYEGLKHIVIFALRPIIAGEELTYDYKFPIEDAASKIPCYCGARRCRKYLN